MADEGWTCVDRDVWVRFRPDPNGRQVLCGIRMERDAITSDDLRRIGVSRLEAIANGAAHRPDLPPLTRSVVPDAEAFSRLVAQHYQHWASTIPRPAAMMASIAGVPSPTMHTWIREARLRGLLPAARRKKSSDG